MNELSLSLRGNFFFRPAVLINGERVRVRRVSGGYACKYATDLCAVRVEVFRFFELIFVIVPDYFDKFLAWLDGASSAAVFLGEIQPYAASAGIACAACAVVLLLLDREKRHIPSVVLCVLFLLCALLSFRLTEG